MKELSFISISCSSPNTDENLITELTWVSKQRLKAPMPTLQPHGPGNSRAQWIHPSPSSDTHPSRCLKHRGSIFSHPERWVPFLPTERLWETPVWAWKDIYGPLNPSISRPSKANCILLTAVLCSKSRTPRGKRRQSATG